MSGTALGGTPHAALSGMHRLVSSHPRYLQDSILVEKDNEWLAFCQVQSCNPASVKSANRLIASTDQRIRLSVFDSCGRDALATSFEVQTIGTFKPQDEINFSTVGISAWNVKRRWHRLGAVPDQSGESVELNVLKVINRLITNQ